MKPFSRNMESLNIYTISMYYTWSNSGFTHTNPRRPKKLSRIAEKELHTLVLSCKRARQQLLSTLPVDKPTIH